MVRRHKNYSLEEEIREHDMLYDGLENKPLAEVYKDSVSFDELLAHALRVVKELFEDGAEDI